jgi:proteasome lid subunit RPN8/RPN11
MITLRLSGEAAGLMKAESEAAYPQECCGALFGKDGADGRTITLAAPIANNFENGGRHHRFRIEAEDILRAESAARKLGADVLGFYHSHPDHPASPSGYDKEHALPFYTYVIIAVENGAAAAVSAWELAGDRSSFMERAVEIYKEG